MKQRELNLNTLAEETALMQKIVDRNKLILQIYSHMEKQQDELEAVKKELEALKAPKESNDV